MLDVQAIFKDKLPDADKLKTYGFSAEPPIFTKDFPILDGQFILKVTVDTRGGADHHVYDAQTGEEYFLARVPDAMGTFIGEVHAACAEILTDISEKCFYTERFHNAQTKRIIEYIRQKYGAEPEFLWEKFPEFAALRTQDKVWFALLGKVEKRKFKLSETGTAEIINLKNDPNEILSRIEAHRAYPAYHMNKRYWFSTFLDDALPDEEIFSLIDTSYRLVT